MDFSRKQTRRRFLVIDDEVSFDERLSAPPTMEKVFRDFTIARYDARSSDKWTFNEPRERRIIRFIKQASLRPEQASLILTEVDLPVVRD